MAKAKEPLKPDAINSIFERPAKKQVSGLFTYKSAKANVPVEPVKSAKADIPAKPDAIASIFDRPARKQVSGLFTYKSPAPAPAKAEPTPLPQPEPLQLSLPQKGTAAAIVIKKRFAPGIDIGTNTIKIVQLGLDQNNETRIINLACEELPKEARDNPKERTRVVSTVLKKIIEERNLKGGCFVAVPYPMVKINLIRLPRMPLAEVDNALRWEIKQTTSADIAAISLDYLMLERQKFLNNQTVVLAITALKKEMLEYLSFFETMNFTPLAMEADVFAEIAALDYGKKINPDEVTLFLDFGAGKTSLNIICNDELTASRTLNVTGNSLTRAVSEYCKVAWPEAEMLKKKFDLGSPAAASDKATQARNAILPQLENMVQGIEHMFKHFSYQVTGSQVTRFDRIILSGGAARLNGLGVFLSNRLHNVRVELADTLSILKPVEAADADNLFELAPQMNAALGMALRGME